MLGTPKETLRIGIGGPRGSGKSALARMLADMLRADSLSLGRLRSAIRALEKVYPELEASDTLETLGSSVNSVDDVGERWKLLEAQACILEPYVKSVISECREREARLVVEGTHILPGLYSQSDLQVQVVLRVKLPTLMDRYEKDKKRLGGRELFGDALEQAERNHEMQARLCMEAERYGIPVVEADYLPGAFVRIIQMIPENLIPSSRMADK